MSLTVVLARAGAAGIFINMALHTSATGQIARSAQAASPDMGRAMPLLWLLYSAALLILGVLAWIHAPPTATQRAAVMYLSAAYLIATAVGQYAAFGFIFPEVTLLVTAALLVSGAVSAPVSVVR